MPAVQRGQVYKLDGGSWAYRYRDEHGRRQQVGGFKTKGEASDKLEDALDRARLGPRRRSMKVNELVDAYLAQHQVERKTKEKLTWLLGKVKKAFGDVDVAELLPDEIGAWRMTIAEGHRFEATQSFRQVLDAAIRWGLIDKNPAKLVPNPSPKRPEIHPFASWTELDAVVEELGKTWGPLVEFAAGTGLMPEEWIALERRDLDLKSSVVIVRRTFVGGQLKEYGKTERRRRRVPLRDRVVEALDRMPPRIDSPLVFPALRGGHIDLHNWRAREWLPAVAASGVHQCQRCDLPMETKKRTRNVFACPRCSASEAGKRIYDLRHTYATFSLAAGVSLFTLSRRMGTSLEMIDQTYGHLAPDADDHELGLLNLYDQRKVAAVK